MAAVVIVVASNATSVLLGGKPATTDRSDSQGAGLIEASGAGPDAGVGSLAQIDRSITAWTANLAANDRDFISATNSGAVRRARSADGRHRRLRSGQAAVDTALAIVPTHRRLGSSMRGCCRPLHDFAGALAEPGRSSPTTRPRPAPSPPSAMRLLELGDVDGAAGAFSRLATKVPGRAVTARLSRLAFIRGDPAGAGALASRAFDESLAEGQTGAQLGWYAYLAGMTAISRG